MSELLLDTHVFLWLASKSPALPARLAMKLEDPPILFVSVASGWEIAIKLGLGKLSLDPSLQELFGVGLSQRGIQLVPITAGDVVRYSSLGFPNPSHRDPFDRMLVVQALERGLTLVSADPELDASGVSRMWE